MPGCPYGAQHPTVLIESVAGLADLKSSACECGISITALDGRICDFTLQQQIMNAVPSHPTADGDSLAPSGPCGPCCTRYVLSCIVTGRTIIVDLSLEPNV